MADPRLPEDEEARLKVLFADLAAPLPDDGFSEAVMARVARRRWRRALVLVPAMVAGALVAAAPAAAFVAALARQAFQASLTWPALGGGHVTLAVAAAAAFAVVSAGVQWLEE